MNPGYFGLFYNKLNTLAAVYRMRLLKLRGLTIGRGSKIGRSTCDWPNKLIIGKDCDIQSGVDFRIWQPYNEQTYIKIGDRVFIGHACEFVCNSRITIGNDCLIASGTTFVDVGHRFSPGAAMNTQETTSAEIVIGNDVWIGTSCAVLQGVSIGNGSIVAAGSVVNKSIPENQIWAGVPARFIKNRA